VTAIYGSEAVVLGGTLAVVEDGSDVVVFPDAIVVDDGVPV
jgi:hypothetical protein